MRIRLPKPPKVPRPRVRTLRDRLQQLITLSAETRIAALVEVMHWYDDAAAHLLSKNLIGVDAAVDLQEAKKLRQQGIASGSLSEKENKFSFAIDFYRRGCDVINTPRLAEYYKKLAAKTPVLERREQRLQKKHGELFQHLQRIVGSGMQITVTDSRKPVQHDPWLQKLCYNRVAATQLSQKFHKEGLLPVFLNQLELLSRRFAFVPDGAGGYIYDSEQHLKATYQLLDSFASYVRSGTAPKAIVRRGPGRGRRKKV